jgi:hypothetical protein
VRRRLKAKDVYLGPGIYSLAVENAELAQLLGIDWKRARR